MAKIRGVKPDLWTDEDFVEVSPLARLLWVGMWNFACDNGHIQDKSKQIKMRILPTDDANCAELLREIEAQGLITRADGWITIPNLTKHQKPHKRWFVLCEKPGCEFPEGMTYGYSKRESTVGQPLANRESTVNNGWSTADGDGDGDGDGELMVMVKGVSTSRDSVPDAMSRDDVTRICEHLADAIEANTSKRPNAGKGWHDAARLMLDRDDIPEADIHAAIDWCQADEFWRGNILSLPKLREKYTQLSLQAQRKSGGGSRQQQTNDIFDRAAVRLGVTR